MYDRRDCGHCLGSVDSRPSIGGYLPGTVGGEPQEANAAPVVRPHDLACNDVSAGSGNIDLVVGGVDGCAVCEDGGGQGDPRVRTTSECRRRIVDGSSV